MSNLSELGQHLKDITGVTGSEPRREFMVR